MVRDAAASGKRMSQASVTISPGPSCLFWQWLERVAQTRFAQMIPDPIPNRHSLESGYHPSLYIGFAQRCGPWSAIPAPIMSSVGTFNVAVYGSSEELQLLPRFGGGCWGTLTWRSLCDETICGHGNTSDHVQYTVHREGGQCRGLGGHSPKTDQTSPAQSPRTAGVDIRNNKI